uniref:Uncharacterized protein n=2 Tax=Brassica campestris TaxID=3711 RepID=M4DNY4_BRACM
MLKVDLRRTILSTPFSTPPCAILSTCLQEYENSKSELKAINENRVPRLTNDFGFNVRDVDAVKYYSLLMVQCRLVLKWSCAYVYFISMHQSAKKQYVAHLPEEATKPLLKYQDYQEELINQVLTFQFLQAQVVSHFKNHYL